MKPKTKKMLLIGGGLVVAAGGIFLFLRKQPAPVDPRSALLNASRARSKMASGVLNSTNRKA